MKTKEIKSESKALMALGLIALLLLILSGCGAGVENTTASTGGTTNTGGSGNSGGSGNTGSSTGTGYTAGTPQTGLNLYDPSKSYWGYTLFAPIASTSTYLIDNWGGLVHEWQGSYNPALSVYLLGSGNLLRTASLGTNATYTMRGGMPAGGAGGRVEEIAPDGTVLWAFEYSRDMGYLLHHDVQMLPNGNVLMIAWGYKTSAEATQAGRNPSLLRDGELWPDHIIEVSPNSNFGGTVVWQWDVWDHLIQDYDPSAPNYGVVSSHPELVDLNFASMGGPADWMHVNSIDYNAVFDQILLSVKNFSEIWVIDHSTTTAEARGHGGGNSGKGGDLLYRWGNPLAYGAGTSSEQLLFSQHDAQWVEAGLPGQGNMLVFNNGMGRPGGNYSSVEEITPPVDSNGNYALTSAAYGPLSPTWSYTALSKSSFYSTNVSGAERLPNGNTLICEGASGRVFEVTAANEVVWEYVNPESTRNTIFRAYRYGVGYTGLSGLDLTAYGAVGQ